MRFIVCGSRSFRNYPLLVGALRDLAMGLPGEVLVEGCARGADRLAEKWARENGVANDHYPADWETHGKSAGFIRNVEMLESGVGVVIAFWDGKSAGTHHTISQARTRGIPVEVVRFDQ